jgi:hypothetical protein
VRRKFVYVIFQISFYCVSVYVSKSVYGSMVLGKSNCIIFRLVLRSSSQRELDLRNFVALLSLGFAIKVAGGKPCI